MAPAQEKDRSAGRIAGRFFVRLVIIGAAAMVIGSILQRMAGRMNADSAHPAGFAQGVAQGALMPMALPNLLVGRDIVIYSMHNTGRGYKLGYTVGVNGCGAVFFGILFWRLQRLRKRLLAAQRPA